MSAPCIAPNGTTTVLEDDWDHLYDDDPDWALCGKWIGDLLEEDFGNHHLCPMCEAVSNYD